MVPKSRPAVGVRASPRGYFKAVIMVVVVFWIPGAVARLFDLLWTIAELLGWGQMSLGGPP
eukprot:4024205-Pleurochrysis_carterae.AAC.1